MKTGKSAGLLPANVPVVYARIRKIHIPNSSTSQYTLFQQIRPELSGVFSPMFQFRTKDFFGASSIIAFKFSSHKKAQLCFIISEFNQSAGDVEVARLVLPLSWFPMNKVVTYVYPFATKKQDGGIPMVLLDVHLSDNNSGPFAAPSGKMPVKPTWPVPEYMKPDSAQRAAFQRPASSQPMNSMPSIWGDNSQPQMQQFYQSTMNPAATMYSVQPSQPIYQQPQMQTQAPPQTPPQMQTMQMTQPMVSGIQTPPQQPQMQAPPQQPQIQAPPQQPQMQAPPQQPVIQQVPVTQPQLQIAVTPQPIQVPVQAAPKSEPALAPVQTPVEGTGATTPEFASLVSPEVLAAQQQGIMPAGNTL